MVQIVSLKMVKHALQCSWVQSFSGLWYGTVATFIFNIQSDPNGIYRQAQRSPHTMNPKELLLKAYPDHIWAIIYHLFIMFIIKTYVGTGKHKRLGYFNKASLKGVHAVLLLCLSNHVKLIVLFWKHWADVVVGDGGLMLVEAELQCGQTARSRRTWHPQTVSVSRPGSSSVGFRDLVLNRVWFRDSIQERAERTGPHPPPPPPPQRMQRRIGGGFGHQRSF